MSKIYIASDTHLIDPAKGYWHYRDIHGDAWHAFDFIINKAVGDKDVVALILAGDVVDKPNATSDTVRLLYNQIDRLARCGIGFYYVIGQHDGRQTWPSVHPDARHLNYESVNFEGVEFYGLDWHPPDLIADQIACIPEETDILIAHQVWVELFRNNAEASLATIPHVSNVFTGDYHRHTALIVERNAGGPINVYSPGCTVFKKIDEPDEHFFYEVNLLDGVSKVSSVPIPGRKVLRYIIEDIDDMDRFVANFRRELDDAVEESRQVPLPYKLQVPIVHVRFNPVLARASAKIAELAREGCHLFTGLLDRERVERAATAPARQQIMNRGWEGTLDEVVPPGSAENYGIRRLMSAQSPQTEIEAMRGEFFANWEAANG